MELRHFCTNPSICMQQPLHIIKISANITIYLQLLLSLNNNSFNNPVGWALPWIHINLYCMLQGYPNNVLATFCETGVVTTRYPAAGVMCMYKDLASPWWRHQMETFSALLAICAGNSPVTGEFNAQRPVTRSFDVFFDLRLNERLNNQSWG